MTNSTKPHIFFVDDEPKIRKVVGETLESVGFKVSCFAGGADCIARLASQRCDLLITDVRMPEMDGVELLTEAKRLVPWIPVLLLTGYGDIPTAVRAIKAGAVNFIEKPVDRETLLSAVESAMEQTTSPDPLLGRSLTKTEMRILRFLMDGNSNKETAKLLHRNIRTIAWHRGRIMRKFGVNTLLELFKRVNTIGLANAGR